MAAAPPGRGQAEDPVLKWASNTVPHGRYNDFLELYRASGDTESWIEVNLGQTALVGYLKMRLASQHLHEPTPGPSGIHARKSPTSGTGPDSTYASRENTVDAQRGGPSSVSPREGSSGRGSAALPGPSSVRASSSRSTPEKAYPDARLPLGLKTERDANPYVVGGIPDEEESDWAYEQP